jgi:hypothetical protein
VLQHVAGPYDSDTELQYCVRCGEILKDNRETSHEERLRNRWPWPGGAPYPVGAIVERGPGWSAMPLGRGLGVPCVD